MNQNMVFTVLSRDWIFKSEPEKSGQEQSYPDVPDTSLELITFSILLIDKKRLASDRQVR